MADEETKDETTEPEAAEPEAPAAEAEEAPAVEAAEPEAAAEPEPEAEEPEPAAEAEAAPAPAPELVPEPEPKKKRKRMPRALRHTHSKPARTAAKERKPIVRTPKPDSTPGRRQERRGVVVSDKGDKTIVVQVETVRLHAKYKKVVRRSNKLHAHDEGNVAGIGDTVRIVETRPLSKTKRWRLAEVVEKAK